MEPAVLLLETLLFGICLMILELVIHRTDVINFLHSSNRSDNGWKKTSGDSVDSGSSGSTVYYSADDDDAHVTNTSNDRAMSYDGGMGYINKVNSPNNKNRFDNRKKQRSDGSAGGSIRGSTRHNSADHDGGSSGSTVYYSAVDDNAHDTKTFNNRAMAYDGGRGHMNKVNSPHDRNGFGDRKKTTPDGSQESSTSGDTVYDSAEDSDDDVENNKNGVDETKREALDGTGRSGYDSSGGISNQVMGKMGDEGRVGDDGSGAANGDVHTEAPVQCSRSDHDCCVECCCSRLESSRVPTSNHSKYLDDDCKYSVRAIGCWLSVDSPCSDNRSNTCSTSGSSSCGNIGSFPCEYCSTDCKCGKGNNSSGVCGSSSSSSANKCSCSFRCLSPGSSETSSFCCRDHSVRKTMSVCVCCANPSSTVVSLTAIAKTFSIAVSLCAEGGNRTRTSSDDACDTVSDGGMCCSCVHEFPPECCCEQEKCAADKKSEIVDDDYFVKDNDKEIGDLKKVQNHDGTSRGTGRDANKRNSDAESHPKFEDNAPHKTPAKDVVKAKAAKKDGEPAKTSEKSSATKPASNTAPNTVVAKHRTSDLRPGDREEVRHNEKRVDIEHSNTVVVKHRTSDIRPGDREEVRHNEKRVDIEHPNTVVVKHRTSDIRPRDREEVRHNEKRVDIEHSNTVVPKHRTSDMILGDGEEVGHHEKRVDLEYFRIPDRAANGRNDANVGKSERHAGDVQHSREPDRAVNGDLANAGTSKIVEDSENQFDDNDDEDDSDSDDDDDDDDSDIDDEDDDFVSFQRNDEYGSITLAKLLATAFEPVDDDSYYDVYNDGGAADQNIKSKK